MLFFVATVPLGVMLIVVAPPRPGLDTGLGSQLIGWAGLVGGIVGLVQIGIPLLRGGPLCTMDRSGITIRSTVRVHAAPWDEVSTVAVKVLMCCGSSSLADRP